MTKRSSSVFAGNADIWGGVYGVPIFLGILLLIFGNSAGAYAFGCLLIVSVIGSWLTISIIEALTNNAK